MYKSAKESTWNVQFLETTIVHQVKIDASSYKKALEWAKKNADEGEDVRVWRSLESTDSVGNVRNAKRESSK